MYIGLVNESSPSKAAPRKQKMKYGIQDTTVNGDQAYEVKDDMEARPRGDGTEPLWVDTIDQAEEIAAKYPGMSVVQIDGV